jgi:hypothetical protein
MTPNRSVSTQPDSVPVEIGRRPKTGPPWPIALIFGGALLTLGWTAFLGWMLYATIVRSIS